MNAFLYFFGRTPALSFAELAAIYPDAVRIGEDIGYVTNADAVRDIASMGGTVKIARETDRTEEPDPGYFSRLLEKRPGPVAFGFSWYGTRPLFGADALRGIKDRLQQSGIHASYTVPHDGRQLSMVAVTKKQITEFNVILQDGIYIIAETIAVQPYEDWNRRDYGKPAPDPKHGMLPPKVARMLVNITLAPKFPAQTVHDPFCGTGTVIAEALLAGVSAGGSDISADAVNRAQKNISWLKSQYPAIGETSAGIFPQDAVHLSEKIRPGTLDAIITEPYLGTLELGEKKVSPGKAKNIIRGLEKLYIGCLRDWLTLLREDGIICMAFPLVRLGGRTQLRVKKPIDTCENLGYTVIRGPIVYGREQAVVLREFYWFRRK